MGCQMNAYDSDFLAQSFIHDGFLPAETPETADVILINTCAVRAKPEQKAYSLLGRMCAIKAKRPRLILGIVGCLAQMKGAELLKRFPRLDLVLGPRELSRFPEILKGIDRLSGKIVATGLKPAPPSPAPCHGYFHKRVTGYVSIMEGCNNFCSYCIVPYVRGREISRPPHEIMAEVNHLLSEGIKEITLLGQNVNSYLWERGGRRWDFPALLHEMSGLERLLRIRFVTSHPKDLSDALISCFKDIKTLCPHIHLPFQAGSNRILKSMRRGYTRETYLELTEKLRAVRPGIAITSDVMVGFPGETDDDFQLTLDVITRVGFDSLFSFKYSDRTGTTAADMGGKIEDRVKASRLDRLQRLQKEITLKKNKALEGKHLEILVEGVSKKGGQLSGRTGSNKIVNFNSNNIEIGSLVPVLIKRSFLNSLRGEPIDPESSVH
ncbi:MAG: tRNA (N6-isopentenyl adenosine(37)-C2)-methylthiotransferase MiaB [Deltaproteobacteria bacterium]|nr:tRNA (N6-isopentenyl adenosine(37)-C2)-methylthiotransferase MiaB [Deltaproteobacteria bacterium]